MPSSVTFISPNTSVTFAVTAEQDELDDDGESVRLSFGALLPAPVTAGTPSASTISITDDDHPIVEVSFKKDTYDVNEGDSVNVMLMLSEPPGRSVTIQIDKTDNGGAATTDRLLRARRGHVRAQRHRAVDIVQDDPGFPQ